MKSSNKKYYRNEFYPNSTGGTGLSGITNAQFDSHTGDSTIHFTESSIDIDNIISAHTHEYQDILNTGHTHPISQLEDLADYAGSFVDLVEVRTSSDIDCYGQLMSGGTDLLEIFAGSSSFDGNFSGHVHLNYDGPDGDSYLFFYNNSNYENKWLGWIDTTEWFSFNYDVNIQGWLYVDNMLYVNHNNAIADATIYFHDGASISGAFLTYNESDTLFDMSHTLRIASGTNNGVYFIRSNGAQESITWGDSNSRFTVSDDFAINGTLDIFGNFSGYSTYIRDDMYLNTNGGIKGNIYWHDGVDIDGASIGFNTGTSVFGISQTTSVTGNFSASSDVHAGGSVDVVGNLDVDGTISSGGTVLTSIFVMNTELQTRSITIEDPSSSENIIIWRTPVDIYIQKFSSSVSGASASVTWNIYSGNGRVADGAITGDSVTTTSTDTFDENELDNIYIAAGSGIILQTSATGGTTTELHVSIDYTRVSL